ncbi:MAG: SusC/RagA family TonB-linked outer membrane protein [Mangrovibacterium sp.]
MKERLTMLQKSAINLAVPLRKSALSFIILGLLILSSNVVSAQDGKPVITEKTVTGKVFDDTGQTIPGAIITYANSDGKQRSALTNIEGEFSIRTELKGSLKVSFIGFKPKEVNIAKGHVFNIKLEKEVTDIDEVVVTGIFTRKTESYTGSSKTIKAAELQSFGTRDVLTSIRNVDPSFNIIESNVFGSDPNQTTTVQIRGNSSIPNVSDLQDEVSTYLNTPLVVIDGFESTMQTLQDMNENDIEAITILKDASATAIYGSRGANGVVVVTTKQPKSGDMRITWRSDVNIEVPDLSQYSILNARDKLELERKVGLYDSDNAEQDLELKKYYNSVLQDVNSGVDTYWLSKPLQTGVGQKHSLRLEGGDGQFRYSGALQYNDISGAMIGSNRRTFNGSVKLVFDRKNFKFQNNLLIGQVNTEDSPYGSFSDYVKLNPYWSGYDEDGNIVKTFGDIDGVNSSLRWSTYPVNPMYNATLNTFDKSASTTITNNTSADWTIAKGLILRTQLGITKASNTSDVFKPAEHTDFAGSDYSGENYFRRGSYSYGSGGSFSYDASANLSYNKLFKEKHFFFAGLNYNIRENRSNMYTFKAEGFMNEDIDYLGSALQYAEGGSPSGTESLSRSIGLTSNINYMYDEKYLADFSFRMDGSSQFGADKRFAPFWSLGLGWNMHEENFMKGSFVNRLKLRGSIGTTGSQNFSSYQALSTYKYYDDDRYYGWSGAALMALGNTDLQWQLKRNKNIGLDAEFWKGRVTATVDLYKDKTEGMISSVYLPPSNGFDSYIDNIGEVHNTGFEFNFIGYMIRDYKKGISWSLGLSGIHNVNKIAELSDALKEAQEELESSDNNKVDPNRLYREGYSMNTIWVVRSLGIDPSTGKEVFLKKDGTTTYEWDSDDLIDGGETTPKLEGNINSAFRRKNLSVTLSIGYRLGGQLYNNTLINKVENADYNYNVDSRVYDDRWQKPGDQAAFKGLLNTNTTYKSTRFVQTENTLTLQNINVKYDLKPILKCFKDSFFESFVVTANASNLFYISTVRQERGTSYPFARTFSFGLNVIF